MKYQKIQGMSLEDFYNKYWENNEWLRSFLEKIYDDTTRDAPKIRSSELKDLFSKKR
mgnify:CR=1 FL=1